MLNKRKQKCNIKSKLMIIESDKFGIISRRAFEFPQKSIKIWRQKIDIKKNRARYSAAIKNVLKTRCRKKNEACKWRLQCINKFKKKPFLPLGYIV